MKCVVVNQSNYIPWKGYFDLIRDADEFVFYDDVQFTKNDWRNRNRIKTPKGVEWITIPVGRSLDRLICEVTLSDSRWQAKHWKTWGRADQQTSHDSNRVWGVLFCAQIGREIALRNIISIQPDYVGN